MKQAVWVIVMLFLMSSSAYSAEIEDVIAPEEEPSWDELIAKNRDESAKYLNQKIKYMSQNYSETQLRAIILNYEKTHRKAADRNRTKYIPYDRKVDVKNPQKVRRFLRRRIDIIF